MRLAGGDGEHCAAGHEERDDHGDPLLGSDTVVRERAGQDAEGGDENERAREDAIEAKKQERADEKNAARKVHVYRWLDDHIEDYADHIPEILRQMDMSIEQFNALPIGAQWSALGSVIGYNEFDDYPDTYTQAELDAYLQPRDDFRGKSRQRHQLP